MMTPSIPEIKQRLYAMRNGVIADSLRNAGSPYRSIFGLNLPQLTEIAKELPQSAEIADSLRENADSRECQLLAPMLYPVGSLTQNHASEWIKSLKSQEAADILCMKLLRHQPYAMQLVDNFTTSNSDMERYAALRLMFYFISGNIEKARNIASEEFNRNNPATKAIAYSILDEISLLCDDVPAK